MAATGVGSTPRASAAWYVTQSPVATRLNARAVRDSPWPSTAATTLRVRPGQVERHLDAAADLGRLVGIAQGDDREPAAVGPLPAHDLVVAELREGVAEGVHLGVLVELGLPPVGDGTERPRAVDQRDAPRQLPARARRPRRGRRPRRRLRTPRRSPRTRARMRRTRRPSRRRDTRAQREAASRPAPWRRGIRARPPAARARRRMRRRGARRPERTPGARRPASRRCRRSSSCRRRACPGPPRPARRIRARG